MPRVKLNSGLFVFVRPSPVGYESSSNFTIQVNLPEYPPEKAALNCGQEHTMVPGRRSDVPGPRPEFPTMVRFSPRATGPQDTGPPDTGPPDTGPLDHRTPDHRTTGPPDSEPPDTGQPSLRTTGHRTTRHRTIGHRTTGHRTTGSAAPDTGQPDTGPPDHNYSCPLSRCWRHGFGKSMGVRQGLNQMAPKCQWMTFISHHPPDTCRRPWEIFEDDCQDSNGRVPSVADTW